MFLIMFVGVVIAMMNAVTLYLFFQKKIVWWEMLPPILMNMVICIGAKFTAETSLTSDYEYHGGWGTVACRQEPWEEWYEVEVDDYCDKEVTENGKRVTKRVKCGSHMETRYTTHYEERWVENSNGEKITTDQQDYEYLANQIWKNEHREDGHHGDYHRVKSGFHYGGEGYLHKSRWPGTEETFVPTTTKHQWVNKVQAADQSLFHFEKVDDEEIKEYGLYELPEVERFYRMRYIEGDGGPKTELANQKLEKWNAKLGRRKEVQMRILVFKDKPLEAAQNQESHWMGGNKNEFIVCVGLDSKTQEAKWAHIITWCENEDLKIAIRNRARSMNPFDPAALVDYMVPLIEQHYIRKEFHDFNYLKVATPVWAYWLGGFLSLLVTVGYDVWAIGNEIEN